jgi:hypothetical protein
MALNSTLNLYFQLALLIGLTLGLVFAKRKKLVPHGWLMLAVFLLNVASILTLMAPVAVALFTFSGAASLNLITVLHALLGAVVLILSIRILATWRFRKPGTSCYALKGEMMRLYIFWIAEVVLGVAIYYQLYI